MFRPFLTSDTATAVVQLDFRSHLYDLCWTCLPCPELKHYIYMVQCTAAAAVLLYCPILYCRTQLLPISLSCVLSWCHMGRTQPHSVVLVNVEPLHTIQCVFFGLQVVKGYMSLCQDLSTCQDLSKLVHARRRGVGTVVHA